MIERNLSVSPSRDDFAALMNRINGVEERQGDADDVIERNEASLEEVKRRVGRCCTGGMKRESYVGQM